MVRNDTRIAKLLLIVMTLAAISFLNGRIIRAADYRTPDTSSSGNAAVEIFEATKEPGPSESGEEDLQQVGGNEWYILDQEGLVIGTLKSENKITFTFYDTTGLFMGTILESGGWQHRLYRKRNTQVKPEEARLYLEALKAITRIRN